MNCGGDIGDLHRGAEHSGDDVLAVIVGEGQQLEPASI